MFNINTAVKQLKQLQHSKIHGLPYKPKQHDKKVIHIDSLLYESIAEREHSYIVNRFRNHSKDFGRRLSKRKGQYHRPGGSKPENIRDVYSIYWAVLYVL